jgi:DNA invertase Pin-like site-specific DNA recombinase
MTDLLRSAKLRPWHLDRLAVVYVRQSTPQQVLEHQESTDRQYALVDRAIALGWRADAVLVIDDDLGKSGASSVGRPGFQRLLAEVALDHVGLILGLEMSRLARSCSDWHQLLELCARFRVVLADADGLYDPGDYNDRLLLGLKGTMSEAELHILKDRMYQGKLNKARRGELFGIPPIGYIKGSDGTFAIDPDEQVQAVVRLIFDAFDREGTLHGLLRYLVHHQVQIPVRLSHGPDRGQLRWRRPNRMTLQNLLHHPSYAGAYRYGHRQADPRRQQPGRPGTGRTHRPDGDLVLLRDRLPAYISWERFEANQERLAANRARHEALGAPRQGAALLPGLLHCGRCQRRMAVRYSGRKCRPSYTCARASIDYGDPVCQSLEGLGLEGLVAEQILQAVQPAALAASLAAVAEVERERTQLTQQWQLRLERADQEVGRAARQYQAVEPENRLVGRELERRWEVALLAQQQLLLEFARWERTAPAVLSAADVAAIEHLAADLPAVWAAATTTAADRQRIARLLLDRVVVTVAADSDQTVVELYWAGGQQTRHELVRRVARYERQAAYGRLVARLTELCAAKWSSPRIATQLNAEGFQPPKRTARFTAGIVQRLASRLGLVRRSRPGAGPGLGADEYRPGALA